MYKFLKQNLGKIILVLFFSFFVSPNISSAQALCGPNGPGLCPNGMPATCPGGSATTCPVHGSPALCPNGSPASCPPGSGPGTGGPGTTGGGPSLRIVNPIPDITSVGGLVLILIRGLIKLGIPFLVIAIIYCGFLFVAAQGNPEKITKARDALLYTSIGGAILLGSWGIAELITETVSGLT